VRWGGGRRAWVDRLLVALVVVPALGYAARWADIASTPVVMVQSAAPIAGAGMVGAAALVAALRRRRLAVLALGFALGLLASVALSLRSDTVEARSTDLVVMSSNLQFGLGDPGAVVERVTSLHVDVLVLLEITPPERDRLRASGIEQLLPYAVGSPRAGADGTVIRSRYPCAEVAVTSEPGADLGQPAARVSLPAIDGTLPRSVLVRAVHPWPPVLASVAAWHAGLVDLAGWARGQPQDEPLVLAGDFNAGADHPAYRALADGLVDAHAAAGSGWVRTWPQGSRIPAFTQLDHVLGRSLQVVSAGSAVVPGSDHAAVWARWRLP
jgi:endonuclease/exonuclease/phosphatase (EEP) superfamily protein YafD